MTRDLDSKRALERSPAWRQVMSFYRTLKPGLLLMRLPLVGPRLQKAFIPPDTDANWFIPVGESIPLGGQYILPGELVARLLRAADGIFAMAACPCRTAFNCKEHSRSLGCLHLGPAVKGIPPELGRLLTLEQGLSHLEQALADGLMPTILHIPSEAEIFRVEKTHMLSLCFCCECCCDVRLLLRRGPDRYWDQYNHRLPGVQVTVSQDCTLCGECLAACYGGERVIRMGAEWAEIGERCLGCGRCVSACPEGAMALEIDPHIDLVGALFERIASRVRIGPEYPAAS